MNSFKIFSNFCFLLLIGILPTSAQTRDSIMPDFKFFRLEDSSPFTKNNIDSKKKSIIILFDTSCSHCQDEIAAIGKQYSDFKNVNLYLVSMDIKTAIEVFMEKYGKELKGRKNVTVLQDSSNDFVPKFNPTKFPAMYIYSENKKLISYFGGQKDIKEIVKVVNSL